MRFSLTPRAALVALVGVLPVVLVPTWWMLLLCALVLAVALVIDLLLAPRPRDLVARRESPGQVRLGTTARGRLLLTNTGRRRASVLVRDAWNPTAGLAEARAHLVIPAGERRAIAQEFTPTRRGEHSPRVLLASARGPWGLVRRTITLEAPGGFRALHAFGSRRHLPSRVRRLREIEGLAAVHHRGQGTEFDSLRDFVDGDDVRSIDWRATARRRNVVVRTWRPERDRHVLIVVDTSRTSAVRLGDAPRLDAALDAALLLTALATQAGDRVDVLCADRIPHVSVSGSSGRTVLHDVISATAPVEPAMVETDWEMIATQVSRRTRRGSLVVLLTPIEQSVLSQGVLPAVARIAAEHPVLIGSVSDPGLAAMARRRGDIEQVHRAAAAEKALAERTGIAHAFGRIGTFTVDAVPDELPRAVADEYLALKAAGRL